MAKGANVVEAGPGRGIAEAPGPSHGLCQEEIYLPLISCPGVFLGHIVGRHPLPGHAGISSAAAAAALGKKQHIPRAAPDPAGGIGPLFDGGETIARVDDDQLASGSFLENLARKLVISSRAMKDNSRGIGQGARQQLPGGGVLEPEAEIPAAAAFPDVGRNLVHAGSQLCTGDLLAVAR